MSNFIIRPVEEDFNHLFDLTSSELKKLNAVKIIADSHPGYPCRVSLQDARIGEEVMLLQYNHHPVTSPYASSGPIFIRRNAIKAALHKNEIPEILQYRLLSLRGYDKNGMMLEAKVVDGKEIKPHLSQMFHEIKISYVHIHNAKPGCFNCVAERV